MKTQYIDDIVEFMTHKRMVEHFENAMGGQVDTFAHSMLDHLARALDCIHGGDEFMELAKK